jgi:Ran GTPase-activating protein (RanGAP) involved in mRNA processing and transport
MKASQLGAIAEALGTNSCITELSVLKCGLDRDGASLLAQALETNSALKDIYLGFNKMGTGAAEIARALKENRSLENVNLSYCDINDDTVNEIASALQENKETALEQINLSGNKITDAGAERLVQALNESNNQTIDKIDLSGCSVSSCSDKRVRV